MKKCYARNDCKCKDRKKGQCYRMENSVALYRPYMHCKYMNPGEIPPIVIEDDVSGWERISWGLIACNKCQWEFPGGAKKNKFCPHCGNDWSGNNSDGHDQ